MKGSQLRVYQAFAGQSGDITPTQTLPLEGEGYLHAEQ